MPTTFIQQNQGWNADPNAPSENVLVDGDFVTLEFNPNAFVYPGFSATDLLRLRFRGCQQYRITPVNDHGWFSGQCRFSSKAPEWGEFYEVIGDFEADEEATPWVNVRSEAGDQRQFLFYLRDSTFEAIAVSWEVDRGGEILAAG